MRKKQQKKKKRRYKCSLDKLMHFLIKNMFTNIWIAAVHIQKYHGYNKNANVTTKSITSDNFRNKYFRSNNRGLFMSANNISNLSNHYIIKKHK